MRFRLLISLLLLPWSLLLAQTPSKTVSANPGTGELIWPDKETFKLINGIASGMSNPMTAPGDLIVGGIGGAPARLGIGLPGYLLAVNLTADGLVWIPAPSGGGGGSGTVTAFSAGNLAPLFTTAVATPATTPALSFSLTLQAANRIFAGPVTGAAAAPTFRALVPADVPDLSSIYLTPAAAALAYVPVTRTVNGHALSGDVTVTKADVGLGNVDNTSDLNKPISNATQTALNGKMSNPMTAAGDLIVGGVAGAPARRAIGTPGQVLAVNVTADGVVWIPAPAGGGGSVTSFSAGALAPLFTTSVATPTTTPALSFSLTNQSANQFFAGPASGGSAAPTMRTLVPADVPDLSGIYLTPAAAALAYVPVTRTVNGHALSGDVTVTKADVGLGNVDNTSDLAKPISTATQTALNAKATAGPVTTSGLTMTTARLLGRTTAAAGAVEEITVGTGLSLAAGVLTATGGSAITALTGDVTATGPGSAAAILATVNTTVGTFGSASLIPVVTVNAKGLVTSVTTIALAAGPAAAGTLTGTTLAANVVNASFNSITPAGGTLAITGKITGSSTAVDSYLFGIAGDGIHTMSIGGGGLVRIDGVSPAVNMYQSGVLKAQFYWNGTRTIIGSYAAAETAIMAGNANIGIFSGTGLAVTGGIVATVTTNNGIRVTDGTLTGLLYASTGPTLSIGTTSNHPISFLSNNATVGLWSSSGLSITGSLSAAAPTATFALTSSVGTQQVYATFVNTGGNYFVGVEGAAGSAFTATPYALLNYAPGGRVIQNLIGGTIITTTSSTGLAVTGSIMASGAATIGSNGAAGYTPVLINGASGGAVQFKTAGAAGGIIYSASTAGMVIDSETANGIAIQTAGATRLNVTSTGAAVIGNLSVTGSISKGSGTFRIAHPLAALNRTKYLVHSFVEGPKADLIYRGRTVLVNGKATVDIDKAVGMTTGTFMALAENPQVWIQNESGPAPVRGAVIGSTLTVESAPGVGDFVSWLVIAERHDETIQAADWTDLEGKPVLEPIKVVDPVTGVERPENKTDRSQPKGNAAKSVKPAPKKI